MKLFKTILFVIISSVYGFGQITFDLSFTGVQWEDGSGTAISPSSLTNCKSSIVYSFLTAYSGGDGSNPAPANYPLAGGGATISLTPSGGAVFTGPPSGSGAGYYTWVGGPNGYTGSQNSSIPLSVNPFDATNGINQFEINIGVLTPNVSGATYVVGAVGTHGTPATYNTVGPDIENTNGSNSGNCVLPIILSKFTVTKISDFAKLDWVVLSEENGSHFEIERRNAEFGDLESEASTFKNIGKVQLNSFGTRDYSFIDTKPFDGINYYRIKKVDLDGTFNFSEVRAVEFIRTKAEYAAFPNPFSNEISIKSSSDVSEINIIDMYGKVIRSLTSKELVLQNNRIRLNDQPSGIYFIELLGDRKDLLNRLKVIKIDN